MSEGHDSENRPSHHARKARGSEKWLVWGALGAAVVVLAVGGGLADAIGNSGSTSARSSDADAAAGGCSITNVADQVLPSVVTIAAQGTNGSGTGSGEVIRTDGYILTNNHVISVAAGAGGSIKVQFTDGDTAEAKLVGRDPQTDLAVLKVQPSHELKAIAFGSSDSVRVGEQVIALGAPLGLSSTVTAGIVSALDRTVEVPGENDQSALLVSAMQTDAAINPGNSGGALVDCDSKLVGVPTAGATVPSTSGEAAGGSIGLGFAIPVDLARTISDEIIDTGTVSHAYFGLQTAPIPAAVAAQTGTPQGLHVVAIAPTGPAAQAGLRPGDVITEIQGQPATSNVQLQELTLTKKPGDKVSMTYKRDASTASATVTLGTQP